MYQPLIKFHPHPAIITQVLRIFEVIRSSRMNDGTLEVLIISRHNGA